MLAFFSIAVSNDDIGLIKSIRCYDADPLESGPRFDTQLLVRVLSILGCSAKCSGSKLMSCSSVPRVENAAAALPGMTLHISRTTSSDSPRRTWQQEDHKTTSEGVSFLDGTRFGREGCEYLAILQDTLMHYEWHRIDNSFESSLDIMSSSRSMQQEAIVLKTALVWTSQRNSTSFFSQCRQMETSITGAIVQVPTEPECFRISKRCQGSKR
jgi:hypothetical protein